MDLMTLAMARALSYGSDSSNSDSNDMNSPFILLEVDDTTSVPGDPSTHRTISSISWDDLCTKAVVQNSLTGDKSNNLYNMFIVKEISRDNDISWSGGIWHCVAIDTDSEDSSIVTMLYFASLTGGVYPTADRQDHVQKWHAWDLKIAAPETQGERPIVSFLGSVIPHEFS